MADTSDLVYQSHGELNDTPVQTPVPQASSTVGRNKLCASPGAGEMALLNRNERRVTNAPLHDRTSLISNVSSLGLIPVDSMEDFSDESGDFRRFMEHSSSQESDEETPKAVRSQPQRPTVALCTAIAPKTDNALKCDAQRNESYTAPRDASYIAPPDASYLAADLLKRKERELALRSMRRAEQMQLRRESDELSVRRAAEKSASSKYGSLISDDGVDAVSTVSSSSKGDVTLGPEVADGQPFNPFSSSAVNITASDEKFYPADSSLFRAELAADEAAAVQIPPLVDCSPVADLSRLADTTQADVSTMEAYFAGGAEPVDSLGTTQHRPCFGRLIRSPVKLMRAQPPIETIVEVSRSESQGRTSADNVENISPRQNKNKLRPKANSISPRFLKDNSNIRGLSPKNGTLGNPTSQKKPCKDTAKETKEASKQGSLLKRKSPSVKQISKLVDLIDLNQHDDENQHPGQGEAADSCGDEHLDCQNGVDLSACDADTESNASESGWNLLDSMVPEECPYVAALADVVKPEQPQLLQTSLLRPSALPSASQRAAGLGGAGDGLESTEQVPAHPSVYKEMTVPQKTGCQSPRSNTGSGSSSTSHVHATKRDLIWSTVALGQRHQQAFLVKNPFEWSARLVAEVAASSPFRLADENGELTKRRRLVMAVNEVCKLSVVFAPTEPGPHTAVLFVAPYSGRATESPRMVKLMGCGGQARLRLAGSTRDANGQHLVTLTETEGPGQLTAYLTLRNTGEVAMFAHLSLASLGIRVLREDVLRVVPSQVVVLPGGSVQCCIIYKVQGPKPNLRQLARLTVTWGEESTRLRLRQLVRRHPTAVIPLGHRYGTLPAALMLPFVGEVHMSGLNKLTDPEASSDVLFDSLHVLQASVLLDGDEDSSFAEANSSIYDTSLHFMSLHEPPELEPCASEPEWSISPTSVTLTKSSTRTVTVHNASRSAQTFEVVSSCPWLRIEPTLGYTEPGAEVELKLTCIQQAQPMLPASGIVEVSTENDKREFEVRLLQANPLAEPQIPSIPPARRYARSVPEPPMLANDRAPAGDLPLGPCGYLPSLVMAVFSDNYRIEFPPTAIGQVASFKVSLKNTTEEKRTMYIRRLEAPFHTTARRYEVMGKSFLRFKVFFKPTQTGLSERHVYIIPDVGPPLRFYFSGRGIDSVTELAS